MTMNLIGSTALLFGSRILVGAISQPKNVGVANVVAGISGLSSTLYSCFSEGVTVKKVLLLTGNAIVTLSGAAL